MKYLIYETEEAAAARSEQEAERRECAYHLGDPGGTRYWWAWRSHPFDGRAALCVPEDEVVHLTPGEQAELVDALPADWEEVP